MKQGKRFLSMICVIGVIICWPFGDARGETATKYKRTIENYGIPDVTLVNQNGARVKFKAVMESEKPVMIDFVYTTCTTICPVLSAGFSNFQRKLGPDAGTAHLVSISIDPENDVPAKMKEYLRRYDAKPGWDFLTGSKKDIDLVLKAFNVNVSNKMSHQPIILIWSPARKNWTKIDGLIKTAELIEESRMAVAK